MSKIGVNILLVITMGTQKCRKKIVKVVTGPFKGSKFGIYYVLVVTIWTKKGPIN